MLKEDGKVVPMTEFIDVIGPGEVVEEWVISCGGIQPPEGLDDEEMELK